MLKPQESSLGWNRNHLSQFLLVPGLFIESNVFGYWGLGFLDPGFGGLGSWGKFVLGINRNWDKINSIKLRQIARTQRLIYRVTLITVVSLG